MNQEEITLHLLLLQHCIQSDPEYESVDISLTSNYIYTFFFLNENFSPMPHCFAICGNLNVLLTFFFSFGERRLGGGNKAAILFWNIYF